MGLNKYILINQAITDKNVKITYKPQNAALNVFNITIKTT